MKATAIFGKSTCNSKILLSKLIFLHRNMLTYHKPNTGNIKSSCGLCVLPLYCCLLEPSLNDYKCTNFRHS